MSWYSLPFNFGIGSLVQNVTFERPKSQFFFFVNILGSLCSLPFPLQWQIACQVTSYPCIWGDKWHFRMRNTKNQSLQWRRYQITTIDFLIFQGQGGWQLKQRLFWEKNKFIPGILWYCCNLFAGVPKFFLSNRLAHFTGKIFMSGDRSACIVMWCKYFIVFPFLLEERKNSEKKVQ